MRSLLLLSLVCLAFSLGPADFTIGSLTYTVGPNLDLTQYPPNTAFSITDMTNPNQVYLTIQQALTNIGVNGGGTLNILAGVYVMNYNLHFTYAGVKFQGAGPANTILRVAAQTPPFSGSTSKNDGLLS